MLVNAYIRFIVDSYIACVRHVSQRSVSDCPRCGGKPNRGKFPPRWKREKKNVPIVPSLIEHLSNVKRDGTPL